MAYRKIGGAKKRTATKRKKGGRRRRAKVGAINIENVGMTVLGIGAGAIAVREVNTLQQSMGLGLSPMIMGLVQVAAGVYLTTTKTPFMRNMGYGAIAQGVLVEATSLNLISGVPSNRSYQINGTPNLAVVGRTNRLPRVAGTPNLAVVGAGQPNNRIANMSRKFNGVF